MPKNKNKIDFDKYYTPDEISQYCINVARKILKNEKITDVIEPSAGNGSFSKKIKNCTAYDIEPEDNSIIKQDFLKLNIQYKQGRLFIGNPPFGVSNTMAVSFYKKCVQLGDFICFILPISQYKNNYQMYDFDLIHSEKITSENFKELDKRIKLCFNIYRRNPFGLNKKPDFKLKTVKIIEKRRGTKKEIPDGFIIGICNYGWSIGKEPKYVGQYSNEFYIYSEEKRSEIFSLIKNADWRNIVHNMTSTERVNQWQVYKYIKENIDGIQ